MKRATKAEEKRTARDGAREERAKHQATQATLAKRKRKRALYRSFQPKEEDSKNS